MILLSILQFQQMWKSCTPIILLAVLFSGCYISYLPSAPLAPSLSDEHQNVFAVSAGPAYGVGVAGANLLTRRLGGYYLASYRPKLGNGTTLESATADLGLLWSITPGFEMVLGGGVGQNELHEEGNDPRPFDSPYNGYENRSVSYSKLFAQVDLAAIEDTHGRLTIAARFERSRFKESSNWQRQEDADTLTPGSTTHDGLASIATICAIGKGQLGNSNAWLVGSFGPCFSLSDPYTGFSSAWILGLGVQWYY